MAHPADMETRSESDADFNPWPEIWPMEHNAEIWQHWPAGVSDQRTPQRMVGNMTMNDSKTTGLLSVKNSLKRTLAAGLVTGLVMVSGSTIKPRTVHAGTAPITTIAAVNNGIVMISPARGLVTFCPGTSFYDGSNPLDIAPTGHCATLTGAIATPTTDKWLIVPVPGGNSFYLVDTTSGGLLSCAAINQIGYGTPPAVSSGGTCVNFGTAPQ
jgi:hypothetical protein